MIILDVRCVVLQVSAGGALELLVICGPALLSSAALQIPERTQVLQGKWKSERLGLHQLSAFS